MHYQTYAVSTILSDVIQCYWTLDGSIGTFSERQTIVPDGCMEMIFHYGDLYKQYLKDGSVIIQPRCFVIGQLTRPLEIAATGRTGIFSVRFNPDGFSPFSDMAPAELENNAISLKELFGDEGEQLATDVLTAMPVSEKIQYVEQFLTKRLVATETIDRITRSLIEAIWHAQGQISVSELSRQSNINVRRLERRFSANVGMTPKQLSRVVRLQIIFKKLLTGKADSFTPLAYEGKYFDQSHFVKEFKQLTGFTPKQYYHQNLKISALLYGNG